MRLIQVAAVAVLLVGCRAMPIEEAKKVTASFEGSGFVPPPRTISDIKAILDEQKRQDLRALAVARNRAGAWPPVTDDHMVLGRFYFGRGLAAREVGRARQEIEDLTQARELIARTSDRDLEDWIVVRLGIAEFQVGNHSRVVALVEPVTKRADSVTRAQAVILYALLTRTYAWSGNAEAAEQAAGKAVALQAVSRTRPLPPNIRALVDSAAAQSRADVLELRGELTQAESAIRQSLSALMSDPGSASGEFVDVARGVLARLLALQGRLLEAEVEARRAVLGALALRGRYSPHTANMVKRLTRVLFEQGRYAEAEALARAAIEIYEKTRSSPESSLLVAEPRKELAAALAAQGRWAEALSEYDILRTQLNDERLFQYLVSQDPNYPLALVSGGRAREAEALLVPEVERGRALLGAEHSFVAERRALLAMARAARGDRMTALADFVAATPALLQGRAEADDEDAARAARGQRVRRILTAFIDLLADLDSVDSGGLDPRAEAFRLADVARGQAVQRGLDASAARAAARTPRLADLVRREQDAKKQLAALRGRLVNLLSASLDRHDTGLVESLQVRIASLARARETLREDIRRDFPAYVQLINPAPASIEHVRTGLRPGEALVSMYVTSDRTLVWAIPFQGPIAFHAAPLGHADLAQTVERLRRALDPRVTTLGEIPEFDVVSAHGLFRSLLEPVRGGWEQAQSLFVVADGPLAHLPLGLLPTRAASLAPEDGALFSPYRKIPWLIRTHAVTTLPSVTSLATLRSLPTADPSRRPFAGFGDPHFSREQAQRARVVAARARREDDLSVRSVSLSLRALNATVNGTKLAFLPRLPDTAEEITSIALALGADQARDVFLGERANEQAVKTLPLDRYRVIAFATHGLVPGELEGLTQPALALSSPDVVGGEGDGLLTMEEILALRLNADWVVLSACNTASGHGAGSEAISGLGRAFFYAGARALLVSGWPVETTSARVLTTDLFRRQVRSSALTRARALQQTMNDMIDRLGFLDRQSGQMVFSYAHPLFWAAFTLVGDGA